MLRESGLRRAPGAFSVPDYRQWWRRGREWDLVRLMSGRLVGVRVFLYAARDETLELPGTSGVVIADCRICSASMANASARRLRSVMSRVV